MSGTVYVVRHAKAGSRSNWAGPDSTRPLTPAGVRQADAIATMLANQPVARIVSSPFLRCRQTVEPLATKVGIPVEADDSLAEGSSLHGIRNLLVSAGPERIVICSHGDVIGGLIEQVQSEGARLDHTRRLEKGSVWELEVRNGRVHRGRYHLPL